MRDDLKAQLVGTYCSCFNIQYNEIALFVSNIKSINTIEDLNNYMVCCKQCKLCCPDIQKIIDYYKK